jgi:hypothetical protein
MSLGIESVGPADGTLSATLSPSEHKGRRKSNFVDLDALDSNDMMAQLAAMEGEEEEGEIRVDELQCEAVAGGGLTSFAPENAMMAELAALEAEEEAERMHETGVPAMPRLSLDELQEEEEEVVVEEEEEEEGEEKQEVNVRELSHKERLIEFYRQHNPSKLCEVDENLKHFQGREDAMFALLEHKYTHKPPQLVANPVYQRLEKFYVKFAPEKLKDIPAIMVAFRGKEEKMWNGLHKKYVLPLQKNLSPSQSFPASANRRGSSSMLAEALKSDGAQLKEEVKAKMRKMRKRLSLAM